MTKAEFEEKKARIKDYRPIDDVFFEMLAKNKDVCQEILRVIMGNPELVVKHVTVQSSERNLYGRSVRLDALCVLNNGTLCNIEVQRSDNDNHLKRARFNASSITTRESHPGEHFEDIVDLYIIYISEFDFLHGGLTIYHIDKCIRETGEFVNDGLHEIFVNTAIDDHTEIAELMACMKQKEVNNPKFPHLSNEVKFLKETEGGVVAMCDIMEKYIAEAEKRVKAETEADIAKKLISRMSAKGISAEQISELSGYDLNFVKKIQNQL